MLDIQHAWIVRPRRTYTCLILIEANFDERLPAIMLIFASSTQIGANMTHSPNNPHTDPPSQKRPSEDENGIGYKKPPRHSQFAKGRFGNPAGRPKAPFGISIKEILDGEQRGKNGEVISRREAYVIALVNEALRGNQKAFVKFMNLMERCSLLRREQTRSAGVIHVPEVEMTEEEFMRNFGRPMGEPPR